MRKPPSDRDPPSGPVFPGSDIKSSDFRKTWMREARDQPGMFLDVTVLSEDYLNSAANDKKAA
jgi:hypothetical protein